MNQSAAAHAGINAAISNIANCKTVPAAITVLTNAANTRNTLQNQARALDISALAGAGALRASLLNSLSASSAADAEYAAWGSQVKAACKAPAPHTAHYLAAGRWDGAATKSKTTLASEWNPMAKTLGLPPISPSSL
jgi:hypothetical protein